MKQIIGLFAISFFSISPVLADSWDFRCLQSVGVKPIHRLQLAIDSDADGVGYILHHGDGPRLPIRMVEEKELHRGPAGRPSEFETRWLEAAPKGRGGHYVYVNQGAIIDNFRYIRNDGTILRFADDPDAWTERGCTWATDGTNRRLSR